MNAARAIGFLLLALLVGCGLFGDGDAPERRRGRGARAERVARAAAPWPKVTAEAPDGGPKAVVFVVLDTVRADHTSLCGYHRPTTPTLERLARRNATHTCRAYAPGSWTHPSHASFFTGKPVAEHGAIWVTESEVAINPVTRVRPLNDGFTTVAETFRERGYQTVAVSGNMIVTPASGLLQGFDTVVVTPTSLGLRDRRMRQKLVDVIRGLDPTRPLFLFVNFYDAHDPYPAIPPGIGWVPPQPRLDLHPNDHDEQLPYVRYVRGLSTDEEAAPYLRSIVDGYDWGIHEADRNLGALVQTLTDAGWLGNDHRLVVTADHGEMLGEHRLLRHGGFLYEGMVNVPLLVQDTTAGGPPSLPEPVSGVVVHDLLLTGRVPDLPVVAATERNDRDVRVGFVGAAVWHGRAKATCADGVRTRVDLAADPGEAHPTGLLDGDPLGPALDEACAAVDRMMTLPPPKAEDPELVRALRAVGYME